MATNIQVLNTFKSYIGEGGSRAWKYCGMSGGAWCDAEVSTVFHNAGADSLWFGKQTYCPTTIKLCDANMAMIPPYLSMGGEVIFFDWQPNGVPDHIGMVVNKIDTDTISTIEGNTGSPARVRYKTRPVKYVLGVYRPLYKPTEADKKAELTCDGDFGWQSIYALQRALKISADGILGKDTVKALQKKAGVSADGAWGKGTSKAVQKMVGTTADGAFGKNSVIALQKWINAQNGSTPTPTPEPTPSKKGYDGTFPDVNVTYSVPKGQLIADKANEIAWSTNTSKADYKGGDSTSAFKVALNKAYPAKERAKWGKAPRLGASCDVAVGTTVRASGVDTSYPRGLDGQKKHLPKSIFKKTKVTKVADLKNGDIFYYSKGTHTAIYSGGKTKEAGLEHYYMKTMSSASDRLKKSGYYVWRATGTAIKTREWLQKGDKNDNVRYLQNFLNWYGNYELKIDGEFGNGTEAAVKDFESREGLTVDGQFGKSCLARAKEIKK